MQTRWARTARGWSAATASALVAAVFHVAAGGAPPHPVAVVLAMIVSGLGGTLLAGRTISTARLTATVGLSQVVFHSLFTLVPSSPSAVLASAHHGVSLVVASPAHSAMHADGGVVMTIAHVIAALATVALLRGAERVVFGLAAFVRAIVGSIVAVLAARPAPVGPRRALGVGALDTPAPVLHHVLTSSPRRGPPVLSAH